MGGKLPPCLPDEWLRDYPKENDGRICPHVELAPQNTDAALFVGLYLSEGTRPFLTPVGMSFGFKHEWDYTRKIWQRVKDAVGDPDFQSAWDEATERWKAESKKPKDDAELELDEV